MSTALRLKKIQVQRFATKGSRALLLAAITVAVVAGLAWLQIPV